MLLFLLILDMNKGVSPPCSSFFADKGINLITFDPCESNVYQQYVYGNTPIMVPQFHTPDEVIKYMVPSSLDESLLILYPNNKNISLSGLSGRNIDPGTQTIQFQTDSGNTDLDTNKCGTSPGDYDFNSKFLKKKRSFSIPGSYY